jgi:hypothetical protein
MNDTTVRISSKCPTCGESRVVSIDLPILRHSLMPGEPVECMCVTCSEVWPLTDLEKANVVRGLKAHEARV